LKPLIVITSDIQSDSRLTLNWNYAEQIAKAGGNPIIVSPLTDLEEVVELFDGWLIPGGADFDSAHYGQELHPKAELQHPERWKMEERMYSLIPKDLPVLGICGGCQFLNVIRGGSLHQHLPDVVGHDEHSGGTIQNYMVSEQSGLAAASQSLKISGKSYHHQSVDRLGVGLVVTAHSEDGTVEAVEDPSRSFCIGVQWHPERTPEDSATQNLFKAFIEAASKYRGERS